MPLQEISKNPEANRNQDERLDRMERDIQTVANKVVNVEKKVNNVEKKTIKDNQKVVELLKKRKPGRKRKVDTEGLVGAQKENQNISQEQAAVTKGTKHRSYNYLVLYRLWKYTVATSLLPS